MNHNTVKQFEDKLMDEIAKEGHSFPHDDTCGTCDEDFDRVEDWGAEAREKEILEIIINWKDRCLSKKDILYGETFNKLMIKITKVREAIK